MERMSYISVLFVMVVLVSAAASPTWAQADVADVFSRQFTVPGNPNMSYFFLGPKGGQMPSTGCGLLVVLPGGDGGPNTHPFVKRVYKYSLPDDFVVVQPLAVRWVPEQEVIWPTKGDDLAYAKFTTEEFVAAVIKAVQRRQRIDPDRVFLLGWSSSGPAAYAISLQKDSPIVGSYIAMSVFQPEKLGSLEQAAKHAYFIDHCPEDEICPFQMASEAQRMLAAAGARVQLNTYTGGHGWQGDVFPRITRGIQWLQQSARIIAATQAARTNGLVENSSASQVFHEDFEQIDQWHQGARLQGVEYLWDRERGHEGTASLSLKKTVNRYFPIAQWYRTIPCLGPATLDVSAWVKAENASKAAVDLQFRDSSGRGLGHQAAFYVGGPNTSDPPANHDWKQYGGIVEVPAGTRSVIIGLQIFGPGAVWFDSLDIRPSRD